MLPEADRTDSAPAATTDTPTGSPSAAEETNPSIAVLPFVNMSPDADNAFFADGISEELLNILAGVDGLAVASRTSAFSFRDDSTPIPEIASALNVRYVLEGSVRRQGDRVRITSQLIDAQRDVHLWSDTYERQLDDIFRVQETIAQSITSELTGILIEAPVQVDSPTTNLEAYENFLRGRSMFYQRATIDQAIVLLQRAVELDPQFAQAWAFLGASQHVVSKGGYATDADRLRLSEEAGLSADRALALNGSIPIALAIKGQNLIDREEGRSIEDGLRLLAEAAEASVVDSTPRMWLGIQQLILGRTGAAFESFRLAREQDPLVPINNGYFGVAHAMLGRPEEGADYTMRAAELNPSLFYWNHLIATDAAIRGDTERAIELTLRSRDALPPSSIEYGVLDSYASALDQGDSYAQWLAEFPPPPGPNETLFRLMGALLLGDMEAALDWDRNAIWVDQAVVMYSAWLPSLKALREHPRYLAMADSRGNRDYWRASGFPMGCRPVIEDGVERLRCEGAE